MDGNLGHKDEYRRELIDGKIVIMSPVSVNHAFVSGNIKYIFLEYLKGGSLAPAAGNFDVYLTEKDIFAPDLAVVCDVEKIKEQGICGAPDLVVEVLSSLTIKNDKIYKNNTYAKCGVKEYWIVSPEGKYVEVYRSNESDLVLYDVHALLADWEMAQLSEEERAAVETHFKCSLFDDLEISLEDVFYRTF